jgi:AcrR family transcriptional regulator
VNSSQEDGGRPSRAPRRYRNDGVRRAEILTAAVDRFGRHGYENTKWADIADDVGIGPTALYHYFDSKQHCLYVILAEALKDLHQRFDTITATHHDPREALRAICVDAFELAESDVLRNRVLVSEQALLGQRGRSSRDEEARRAGRDETRALELAWTRFLADAMQQGAIAERDPRLLARALLGLYNSIWHWYRPDEFFVGRILAVAGVAPEPVEIPSTPSKDSPEST